MEQWRRSADLRLGDEKMTLYDFLEITNDNSSLIVILIIFILSIVEVSKIKINPLSFFGKIIFKRLIEEISSIKSSIESVKTDQGEIKKEIKFNAATSARYRILRFNDEVLHGKKHTKEHFDEILTDIDKYESFCKDNKDYENNKGKMAMKNVKNVYQKCSDENSFL